MKSVNASVMETCSYPYLQPLPPQSSYPTSKHHLKPPISAPKSQFHYARLTSLPAVAAAALKTPKGFGPPAKRKTKKPTKKDSIDENDYKDDEEEDDDDEEEENVIPEIVTNRMMNRIAFSVGTPLFIGIGQCLKLILKIIRGKRVSKYKSFRGHLGQVFPSLCKRCSGCYQGRDRM